MKKALALAFGVGALLAGYSYWHDTPAINRQEASNAPACQAIVFEGSRFTQCVAIPGQHRITTRITGSNGVIYRGFAPLLRDVDTRNLVFAMNGGMYDTSGRPIGYYVESKERLHGLNQSAGHGNFYLEPNGVFFGSVTGPWKVLPTEKFRATVKSRPEFGTQSGPMLLIDGQFNPQISQSGTSLKIRNAVGIDGNGQAHFVISGEPVSFGRLARLMRDHCKTSNALFLDGTVSSLLDPASGRLDAGYPLGPLIVVEKAAKGHP